MKPRLRVFVFYGWTLGQWAEAVVYYRRQGHAAPPDICGAIDVWLGWTNTRRDLPTGTPAVLGPHELDFAWASRMFENVGDAFEDILRRH